MIVFRSRWLGWWSTFYLSRFWPQYVHRTSKQSQYICFSIGFSSEEVHLFLLSAIHYWIFYVVSWAIDRRSKEVYNRSNPEATLNKQKNVTDIFRTEMTMFHFIHAEQRTSYIYYTYFAIVWNFFPVNSYVTKW